MGRPGPVARGPGDDGSDLLGRLDEMPVRNVS